MAGRFSRSLGLAATCFLWGAAGPRAPSDAGASDDLRRAEELSAVREEIGRLRGEAETLLGRERSVLEEIRRLDTEAALKRAEVSEATERISIATRSIEERARRLEELEKAQTARRRYLTFRLREIYKRGPEATLRRIVDGEDSASFLAGIRTAAYLSEKDRRTIDSLREDARLAEGERGQLLREREELAAGRADAERARAALVQARREKRRYLGVIQRDRRKTLDTLRELEDASKELGGLAGTLSRVSPPTRDPDSLRGSLDWPVYGKVALGFGRTVHPQFKTVVPHPGLDIEAPEGSDIRAVADGKVAYSSWLRGYGLTAILEHGGGLMSVYAHAAVLLVEVGEEVNRGQVLGKVGDTGSLRGPYLYFEVRKDGKPLDPAAWLRRR